MINAGKTVGVNEDQATVQLFVVTVPVSMRDEGWADNMCEIPCIYFAVFDGHAGKSIRNHKFIYLRETWDK